MIEQEIKSQSYNNAVSCVREHYIDFLFILDQY